MAKRVTLATIKAFIRKNKSDLYIKFESSFSGQSDMVESLDAPEWVKAANTTHNLKNSLGVNGAYFIGRGARDYFEAIDADGFVGFSVYNACGSFSIGIKKGAA